MHFPFDALQVQLVNSWWEQLIPVAALLLSLFSVGLTLVFRYTERLNLKVATHWSNLMGGNEDSSPGTDRIGVEVTNRSRSTTTEVTHLTLEFSGKKHFIYTAGFVADSELPMTLGPGQSATHSFSAQGLGFSLNGGARHARWVRAKAVCGHRTFYGKRDYLLARDLRAYVVEYPPQGDGADIR